MRLQLSHGTPTCHILHLPLLFTSPAPTTNTHKRTRLLFTISIYKHHQANRKHGSQYLRQKMSGGVGPIDDLTLPSEDHGLQKPPSLAASTSTTTATTTNRTGLLSFRQLNALAIVIILSASGMVSFQEVSFSLLSFLYLLFLSRFSFPSLGREPAVFGPHNRILPLYVTVGAIVGLILPILYIFEGIYEGDKEGIKAAAPHVFLLASQIFMEGVAFSGNFSTPIRVLVPVFFNAMRMLTLMEWLVNEFSVPDDRLGWGDPRRWAGIGSGSRRAVMGRALALANTAFWSFNLFCFLLPVYMPKAFKMYYSKLLKEE